MNPIRKKKLEAEILRILSLAILEGKVKDPRVFLPTFHRIDLTDDLKKADIHFTALCNNAERKKLTLGLASSSGFLSSLIGKQLHLHTNPRLYFKWDNNYIKSLEVIRLIDESKPKTLYEELHPTTNPTSDENELDTDAL
ncbi:ribosome-binding factor A [Leptospira ryugenii]|uniref:Ribosome-binding factor A n=1 Tax=Leptospira ryugenii TaxID=1917863 RepID=A0A2P2DXE2_9LEPT|nr:30S ribosome-binding factor RbfA [Leptospira ryugenii]GBF49292.1 ribosome-binding factor A [Leptospira ryugenii]